MISSSWNGSQTFYAYDALGNRTRMSTPSGTSFYSYDQETGRRLLSVSTFSGTFTFSYDQNGNLTGRTFTPTSSTPTPPPGPPDPGIPPTPSPEPEGSFLESTSPTGTWNFSYDPLNRLKEVKLNGVTVGTYSYNGMGKRVSKGAGTVNSIYLWDGEKLAQETRGGINYLYSYLGMNPIALTSGNSSQVLETDLLGSVLGVVNSSGQEIARYITDDFGNLQDQSGNSPNPFLFAGSFFDCESGLYQMRGRYYDPLMGRFLTQDLGPGNPYTYCRNNPVSMVDPSGWMWMYRASVLGGEAGTWKDALDYFCGSIIEIGYDYALNFKMDHGEFYGLIDLTDTLVSPYVGTRSKILEAALFFEGMEAAKIFPEEDEFNCCANFVSLVLRMAGVFGKNENYRYIGGLNNGSGGLQDALYNQYGFKHSPGPKGPGDIIIFYKDRKDRYHHVGIYLGNGLYIGSNNYPSEEAPQWIRIDPIFRAEEVWYWW